MILFGPEALTAILSLISVSISIYIDIDIDMDIDVDIDIDVDTDIIHQSFLSNSKLGGGMLF